MYATAPCDIQKADAENYLHDRPDIGDRCVTVVLDDGSRHFLRTRIDDSANKSRSSLIPASGSLLTTSMRDLTREAEALQVKMLTNRSSPKPVNHTYLAHESVLWVDKYAPKAFSQLLSSEKINRDVLRALKMWDSYVFGNHPIETGGRIDASTVLSSELMKPSRGDTRPFFKVLLFHGPPGTGKSKHDIHIILLYPLIFRFHFDIFNNMCC